MQYRGDGIRVYIFHRCWSPKRFQFRPLRDEACEGQSYPHHEWQTTPADRFQQLNTGPSELYIGGANPSHYKASDFYGESPTYLAADASGSVAQGGIEYHPVLKQAYFNISGTPLLNGQSVFGGRRTTTIIDSGKSPLIRRTESTFSRRLIGVFTSRYNNDCGPDQRRCSLLGKSSWRFGAQEHQRLLPICQLS